ncbi:MAG: DoxX family protein [Candidatus Nitrosocosmicus sp.]
MDNEDDVFLFFVFFKNKMINSFRLVTFGPIAIRTVSGATFIINGWPKLFDMILNKLKAFFVIMGLPQELAAFMALLEVFGGALLIIGVLTRI